MIKINLEELKAREKYVYVKTHPTLSLLLWNYKPECQYERAWDKYTKMCRGLITDENGIIVARPFTKFFNLNEEPETKMENLPAEVPVISEKMDGSLGIQYYCDQEVRIATRGSFESDQSQWATWWMRTHDFSRYHFKKGYTYLYEIIYPENRIVIDYGTRKELVLLAVIHNETGEELDVKVEGTLLGLKTPEVINQTVENLVETCKTLDGKDHEGFVLRYSNGLRVKMKGIEYVRLHKLITGFSSKSIWECLKNGDNLNEILTKVPDEFYKWVKDKELDLKGQYNTILYRAQKAVEAVQKFETRKEQALVIMQYYKDVSGIVFGLLGNKDVKESIWKMLKPKYELPFKKENK